jgi:hypothetical protein
VDEFFYFIDPVCILFNTIGIIMDKKCTPINVNNNIGATFGESVEEAESLLMM